SAAYASLLSGRARGGRRRRLNRRRPTQRTTDVVVVARFHVRAALRHLRLELFFGQRHRVAEIDEHVGDRTAAAAGPVAGVGWILVLFRRIEEADQMHDRAL